MTVTPILEAIRSLRVLIVGDICLDRWCTYDPCAAEPSRETSIPRIGVVSTEITPGAGGTIANNVAALGAGSVSVLGVIGDDGFGYELKRGLAMRGIGSDLLVIEPGLTTFTYTKLINSSTGCEDLPRVDFITTCPLATAAESRLIAALAAAAEFDVILVSDQAETNAGGCVTPAVRDCLSQFALRSPEKIVWVDSRKRPEHFRHVILKPNRDEADDACQRAFSTIDYRRLREHTESRLLLVTDGPDGVKLFDHAGEQHVATRRIKNPVDICGAGDSFSAGAALALAVTGDALAAARFGNIVASITVMKPGTGTASPPEVEAAAKDWMS